MERHAGQKQENQQQLAQLCYRVMERVLGNSGDLETVNKALKCYHVSSVTAGGNEDKWIA